jgi:hypothetical protein
MRPHHMLGLASAVALSALAAWNLRPAPAAIVAEWSYATCTGWLNCGNCLLGFSPDQNCASGWRCIAFKGTAGQHEFKLCTPSDTGTHECYVDDSANPNVYCWGFLKFCGCWNDATGRCPHEPCNCNWGMQPDRADSFHVNATCQ